MQVPVLSDRNRASFSDRRRQSLKTYWGFNSEQRRIGKGERGRETRLIRDFFDGRYASQYVKEHVFDRSGIGECTIFSDMCTLQLSRHVFQAMTGPIGIKPACEIKDIRRAISRPPKASQGHHQHWEDEVRSSSPGFSVSNWISHGILAFDASVRAGSRVTITFRRTTPYG